MCHCFKICNIFVFVSIFEGDSPSYFATLFWKFRFHLKFWSWLSASFHQFRKFWFFLKFEGSSPLRFALVSTFIHAIKKYNIFLELLDSYKLTSDQQWFMKVKRRRLARLKEHHILTAKRNKGNLRGWNNVTFWQRKTNLFRELASPSVWRCYAFHYDVSANFQHQSVGDLKLQNKVANRRWNKGNLPST